MLSNRVLSINIEFQKQRDDDIIAGIQTISLRDPMTRSKIKTPFRSTSCKHLQCFDADTFIQINRSNPKWQCAVCYQTLSTGTIVVDGYFDDILKNTPDDCDIIQIEPDGKWSIPTEAPVVDVTMDDKKRDIIVIGDDDYNEPKTKGNYI